MQSDIVEELNESARRLIWLFNLENESGSIQTIREAATEITALRDRVARLTEIFEDIYDGPAIECIPCTSIQDDIREVLGIPSWEESGKTAKEARHALNNSPPAIDGV
ncbi:MAG: hypothetical protein AB1431_12600 [Pseudomonadota bacterium]